MTTPPSASAAPAGTDPQLVEYVHQAVRLSSEHVARGGIPFTGLVVGRRGELLGTGVNTVSEDRDATAHAEIVALRAAAKQHGLRAVAGSTLIASGEPCALCYMAALHFGVQHIVYAADRHMAARAGFDYADSYRIFATDPTQWPLRVTALPVEGSERPFDEWRGVRPHH